MEIKTGDIVIYQICSCGDVNLTVGKEYKVLTVKNGLIMFIDDNGEKRVKSINTLCFKKKGE